MKKIKHPENSRVYRQEAIALAFSSGPSIQPCKHCGHPVLTGYCCLTCGSDDPRSDHE